MNPPARGNGAVVGEERETVVQKQKTRKEVRAAVDSVI